MSKRAILVVSFGTSYQDTLDKTIRAIEQDVADAFPEWEIRRAFTSGMILRKLRQRDNILIDSVEEALERLLADGFDTVLCQPTHILNGEEYDDIVRACHPFLQRFRQLAVGAPLLSCTEDYRQLATILDREFPQKDQTALCLMGHGTEHFADSAYAALEYHFKNIDRRDILVGTVEGYPDLDALMRGVRAFGAKKAILTPLMVVAGDHAKNDMAGDEEDSWKSAFLSAGYEVSCVLKGLGEYADVRQMYVDHAQTSIDEILSAE